MAGDETALVMASLTSAPAHNPVSGRSATRLSCLNGCLHVALRLPGVVYVTCTQIYVSLSSSIHRAAARDEATEMSDTLNPVSCLEPSDRHQARYCGVCVHVTGCRHLVYQVLVNDFLKNMAVHATRSAKCRGQDNACIR